jgi:oligosaccharide repeat unit polymerase
MNQQAQNAHYRNPEELEVSATRNLTFTSLVGIAISAILGAICLVNYGTNQLLLFAAAGWFAVAVVLIPAAFSRCYDLFSTWTFAALSIVLGVTIRGIYIGFQYPDFETLDYFYFRSEPVEFFIWPAIIVIGGIVCLAAGYVSFRSNANEKISRLVEFELDPQKIRLFAYAALAVSVVSTLAYAKLTGGFDLSNLSRKRVLIDHVEVSNSHRSWQFLRVFASTAMLAHLLVVGDALRTIGPERVGKFLLAAVLFGVAIFLPFYTSSRGTVMMYGIFSIGVFYYAGKKIPWGKIAILSVVALIGFQLMSVMRTAEEMTVRQALSESKWNFEFFDRIVLNRNEIEIAKTAHIMNAIPHELSMQYGKTIGVWFLAPIPRSFWNSKPLVSSGPIIGTTIYKNRISGVPPGFVAEMYWNFHVIGVFAGCLLLGFFLRWTQINFSPQHSTSLSKLVIYVFGPMQVGYLIVGTALGYGIVNATVNTIWALIILRILKSKDCGVLHHE